MSEPYQLFTILTDGLPAEEGVRRAHRVLITHGGELSPEDSLLQLSDLDGREVEPSFITDEESALKEISRWPTLGYLDYWLLNGTATVGFANTEPYGPLACVRISIGQRTFESGGEANVRQGETLAMDLHETLGSTRTVMGWALELKGFRWPDEISRLKRGVVQGTYELFDIYTPRS